MCNKLATIIEAHFNSWKPRYYRDGCFYAYEADDKEEMTVVLVDGIDDAIEVRRTITREMTAFIPYILSEMDEEMRLSNMLRPSQLESLLIDLSSKYKVPLTLTTDRDFRDYSVLIEGKRCCYIVYIPSHITLEDASILIREKILHYYRTKCS